jgi:hypothetical protein
MPEVQTPSRQAQTVAIPKRWPLVEVFNTRTSEVSPPQKDARLINGFAEKEADGSYSIYKRPGLGGPPNFIGGTAPWLNTGSAQNGRGIYTSPRSGAVYSVFNGNLYVGGTTQVVDVGVPQLCSFETINTVFPYAPAMVVIQDTVIIRGVIDGGIFPIVAIAGPTAAVGSWAYGLVQLDDTLYIMDLQGNIWGCAFNDPTTWDNLNVIKANNNSDLAVCLSKQLIYILAFKQNSVEVFYDAGTPTGVGSNLARIIEAEIAYGCLFGQTVQTIDNLVLYLSSNQTISPQVILLDNLTPRVVSTPGVDRILDNICLAATANTGLQGVYAWTLKHGGHRFYGLTSSILNITLVLDIDQKLWYIWTDVNGNYWPYTGLAYQPPSPGQPGMHLIQHESNGNIYELDGDYAFPTDYGEVFPVDIYTPNFDAGTARTKQLNMLYFTADQQTGSVLQSRYSDDDYQSWSDWRDIDLGEERPMLDSEGSFYKRAYNFRHQLPLPLRIKSVDMQLDFGVL